MIQSVFDLGDTIAREVMVPRTEVVWIERSKTVRQALALALRSGFSRLPVVGDSADDVLGIAYLKDLARRAQDTERARTTTVEEVMRDVAFVPESKPVDELLREMQAARSHIAVVVDEYGGTAGLITIEDILEEIVGEITDEYDVERAPIERLDDDTARVTARLSVEDLAELFAVELPDRDDVETVGGLLAEALGRVPIPGASAVVHGLELTAEDVGGRRNRIDTVRVHRVPRDDEDAAGRTRHRGGGHMSELDAEDAKLVTLARSARARTGAAQGAAVRDGDGRTYVASTVDLPSLTLSALQVAVAMAVSSGAPGLEAAVVLGDGPGRRGRRAGGARRRARSADPPRRARRHPALKRVVQAVGRSPASSCGRAARTSCHAADAGSISVKWSPCTSRSTAWPPDLRAAST